MIKISFSGFSGSGKTSLLAEVKKILSLKYKVESIEETKGKNPFDSDKKSFVGHFYVMSSQINEENIKTMTCSDFLLCDQSILDQWIQWKNFIADHEMTPQLQEKHQLLKNLYHHWIKSYHLIFYIRLDLNQLEQRELNEELRITDLECIKKIDELYQTTINEDRLKVIEIWNNTSIDESAHEIIKHISEYKEKELESSKEKEKTEETS